MRHIAGATIAAIVLLGACAATDDQLRSDKIWGGDNFELVDSFPVNKLVASLGCLDVTFPRPSSFPRDTFATIGSITSATSSFEKGTPIKLHGHFSNNLLTVDFYSPDLHGGWQLPFQVNLDRGEAGRWNVAGCLV